MVSRTFLSIPILFLISTLLTFSRLEHPADLLQKSISTARILSRYLLFNTQVSAPYPTLLWRIDMEVNPLGSGQ
uniref:Putative secreted protein n=1 Tax=Panstrongylus lignarius TaxID=156445 RepID=A0A224Y5Y8_9HEMI